MEPSMNFIRLVTDCNMNFGEKQKNVEERVSDLAISGAL